jgi:secreted PhoX family phosphatase
MWYGRNSIYFAATTGGRNRAGQIWRYVPSRFEGTADEDAFPGRLELFVEPNDTDLVAHADNLTVAPWGDLIVCEDSSGENDLVGVTPAGGFYKLAHNALSRSEFAGVCFSPDGRTLFVNIQSDGLTLAIEGPWQAGA